MRSLGEEHFPDTVKTLCTGLFADSTSVERSGHAQGLCEVLVALGPERLEKVVSELIPQGTTTSLLVVLGGVSMLIPLVVYLY